MHLHVSLVALYMCRCVSLVVQCVSVCFVVSMGQKSSTELRLLVHKGQIRFIIGTGGSIVKKINKVKIDFL